MNKYLSIFGILLIAGCFNHTLPATKILDRGEKALGASVAFPLGPVPQGSNEAIINSLSLGFSIWYGYGLSNNTDYYIYLGEGLGVVLNSEIVESNISKINVNYGIEFNLFPTSTIFAKYGANYSYGNRYKKPIGFLATRLLCKENQRWSNSEMFNLYGGIEGREDYQLSFFRLGINVDNFLIKNKFVKIETGLGTIEK